MGLAEGALEEEWEASSTWGTDGVCRTWHLVCDNKQDASKLREGAAGSYFQQKEQMTNKDLMIAAITRCC